MSEMLEERVAELEEALTKLRCEACHFRQTKVGERFLQIAEDEAIAVLAKGGK